MGRKMKLFFSHRWIASDPLLFFNFVHNWLSSYMISPFRQRKLLLGQGLRGMRCALWLYRVCQFFIFLNLLFPLMRYFRKFKQNQWTLADIYVKWWLIHLSFVVISCFIYVYLLSQYSSYFSYHCRPYSGLTTLPSNTLSSSSSLSVELSACSVGILGTVDRLWTFCLLFRLVT